MKLVTEKGVEKFYTKNGLVVYADSLLVGQTCAYRIDGNVILLSPAIFELLKDDESKNLIINQVKVIDLRNTLKEIVSEVMCNNLIQSVVADENSKSRTKEAKRNS